MSRMGVAGATMALTLLFATAGIAAARPQASLLPEGPAVATAIRAAIAAERPTVPSKARVTGITVPHHLLAADLMARGFWAAGRQDWKRVIILSPDHVAAARTPVAIETGGHATVFGRLASDTGAVRRLLRDKATFSRARHAGREHGIGAITPFVKALFPRARVVALAISPDAGPDELDRALPALRALADSNTLIIQSTDYAHNLPLAQSVLNDQQTLNVIAAGNPSAVFSLKPIEHLDARGAQYLQMRLQADVFQAAPVVLANRNSAEYGGSRTVTTSYIVKAWGPDAASLGSLRFPDQSLTMFAGDTMVGRYWAPLLVHKATRQDVLREILAVTHSAPLVINLEGVVPDMTVQDMPGATMAMEPVLAMPVLQQANVRGAGLANNHAFDLGREGLEATRRVLHGAGIASIPQGATADINGLRIMALNFVRGAGGADAPFTREGDMRSICANPAAPPLLALVHWGREYTGLAGAEEYGIARGLQRCGVQAIIGAHSHQASRRLESLDGGRMLMVYSLGNFMFDQTFPEVSGALLEIRLFRQGTFAARLVPIRNLFAFAHARNRPEAGSAAGKP